MLVDHDLADVQGQEVGATATIGIGQQMIGEKLNRIAAAACVVVVVAS